MSISEAKEWLLGNRSHTNIIPADPHETWIVRTEQADAATMQQAYWVVRAHKEGILTKEENTTVQTSDKKP